MKFNIPVLKCCTYLYLNVKKLKLTLDITIWIEYNDGINTVDFMFFLYSLDVEI